MFPTVTAVVIVALMGSMQTGTRYTVIGRDPGNARR